MKHNIFKIIIPCGKDSFHCKYHEIYNLYCPHCLGPHTSYRLQKCILIRKILKSIRRGLISESRCWVKACWLHTGERWGYEFKLAIPEEEPIEKVQSVLSMLVLMLPNSSITTDAEPEEITTRFGYRNNIGFIKDIQTFRRIRK